MSKAFIEQQISLSRNHINNDELKLAGEAIKLGLKKCNEYENSYKFKDEEIELWKMLAEIYSKHGQQGEILAYAKAIGIYEFIEKYSSTSLSDKKIEIYNNFLSRSLVPKAYYNSLNARINLLKLHREKVKQQLEQIQNLLIADSHNIIDKEKLNNWVKEVDNLYAFIKDFFIGENGLIVELIRDSVSDLNGLPKIKKGGIRRDIKFSIFGMGSMSLGAMTPWSDMEWGILYEEDLSPEDENRVKEYFRKLTELIYMKVVNLGESPLRMLGIEELNNFKIESGKEDNWFFDNLTKSGFSMDGPHWHACKTPLGRQGYVGHRDFELICTPSKLASMQEESWQKSDPELCQALRHIVLICGEPSLHGQYLKELIQYQQIIAENIFKIFSEDASNLSPYKSIFMNYRSQKFNVKKEIYRFVDRIIVGLGNWIKIDGTTKDFIIDPVEGGIIDATQKEELNIAFTIATAFRLSTYAAYDGQKEDLQTSSDFSDKIEAPDELGELNNNVLLYKFFDIVIRFADYLYSNVNPTNHTMSPISRALLCACLGGYDEGLNAIKDIDHNDQSIVRLKGYLYEKTENYHEELKLYDAVLSVELNKPENMRDNEFISELYDRISIILDKLDNSEAKYTTILKYEEKSLSIKKANISWDKENIAKSLHNISITYRNLKEYEKAFLRSKEAIEIFAGKPFGCNLKLTHSINIIYLANHKLIEGQLDEALSLYTSLANFDVDLSKQKNMLYSLSVEIWEILPLAQVSIFFEILSNKILPSDRNIKQCLAYSYFLNALEVLRLNNRDKFEEYFVKAKQTYEIVINMKSDAPITSALLVEYAQALLKFHSQANNSEQEKIEYLLLWAIKKIGDDGSSISYSNLEKHAIINESLVKTVEKFNEVIIYKPYLLGYYLLGKLYIIHDKFDQAKMVIDELAIILQSYAHSEGIIIYENLLQDIKLELVQKTNLISSNLLATDSKEMSKSISENLTRKKILEARQAELLKKMEDGELTSQLEEELDNIFAAIERVEQEETLIDKANTEVHMPNVNLSDRESKVGYNFSSIEEAITYGNYYISAQEYKRAEYCFAAGLKLAMDQKDVLQKIKLAEFIGDTHYFRRYNEGYTKAAALYNYAINLCKQNISLYNNLADKLNKKLHQLEIDFSIYIQGNVDYTKKLFEANNSKYREKLDKVRIYAQEEMQRLDKEYPVGEIDGDLNDEDKDQVKEVIYRARAEATNEVLSDIAKGMKELVSTMIEDCHKVIGPAPCEYAIIGFGSMAREEMTPWSDFEFGILVSDESKKEYFYNLTNLLYLKVLNLGETILPSMAIKSLNNFYSKNPLDDWFRDYHVTKRGFSFDGLMPGACKLPFGEKDENSNIIYELIHTPENMAKFQIEDQNEAKHIASGLYNTTFVCGNIELVNTYKDKIRKAEYRSKQIERAKILLSKDLEKYDTKIVEKGSEGKLYDVKKEIYRLPETIIDNLAILYGLNSSNGWSRLKELNEKGIINEEAYENLKVVLSIAVEIRLRTYIANGKQGESMSATKLMFDSGASLTPHNVQTIFHIPNQEILFRFYYTIMPFYEVIQEISKLNNEFPSFQVHDMFDASYANRGFIYKRFLDYHSARDCFFKSKNETNNIIALFQIAIIDEHFNENNKIIIDYYQTLIKQIESFAEPDNMLKMSIYSSLASCYLVEGGIQQAEQAINMAIQLSQQNPLNRKEIGMLYHNIVRIYLSQNKYQEAKEKENEALEIFEKECGPNSYEVALACIDLAIIYDNLKITELALYYNNRSLNILQSLYDIHPYIFNIYNNRATIHFKIQKYEEASKDFKKALDITIALYGENHINAAKIFNNLGNIEYKGSKNYDEAIALCSKALSITKNISEKHLDIPYILVSLGNVYIDQEKYSQAIECFEDALKLAEPSLGINNSYVIDILDTLKFLYGKLLNQGKILDLCDLPTLIRCLEILVKSESVSLEEYYHDLGCYYYIQAIVYKDQGKETNYEEYVDKATKSFKEALKIKENSGIYTDYGKFLISIKRYDDAKHALSEAIRLKNDERGIALGQIERAALDENLQKEVDFAVSIAIEAYIFAYYLLLKNRIELHLLQEEIDKYLKDLEEQTKKFHHSFLYSLLGYVYEDMNFLEKAIEAFKQAESCYTQEIGGEFTLAKECIKKCNEKKKRLSILQEEDDDFAKAIELSLVLTEAEDEDKSESILIKEAQKLEEEIQGKLPTKYIDEIKNERKNQQRATSSHEK